MLYFQNTGGGDRVTQTFSVGHESTTVNFPFAAREDVAAGEGALAISFGHLDQSFEITNLQVLNFQDRA